MIAKMAADGWHLEIKEIAAVNGHLGKMFQAFFTRKEQTVSSTPQDSAELATVLSALKTVRAIEHDEAAAEITSPFFD